MISLIFKEDINLFDNKQYNTTINSLVLHLKDQQILCIHKLWFYIVSLVAHYFVIHNMK